MHELAITEQLIEIAINKAKEKGGKKILSLRMKFGKLTMVDPECFKFYFEELSRGTIAEGATLDFERPDLEIECKSCGKSSKPDGPVVICPLCNSIDTKILSGDEMILENMEVEL